MEKQGLSVTQSWAIFVGLLIQTKKAWETHREVWAETPRDEIERLSPEWQKFIARNFNRSEFNIMLPRLVDFWRGLGGIEALRVKVNPKEVMRKMRERKEKEKK